MPETLCGPNEFPNGSHAEPPPIPRWFSAFQYVIPLILLGLVAVAVARPLRAGASWVAFVQDDCFYYLKVAQNLATGHGSTFNGLVQTNGYHPLWLLCLTMFRIVLPSAPFIWLIAAAVVLSSAATYALSFRLLRDGSTPPVVSAALAMFTVASSMSMLITGMEVVLTIPLVLLFLLTCKHADPARHRGKSAFLLGLVVSAMVLSRLDSILLAVLVVMMGLFHRRLRERIAAEHIVGVALGLLPLVAYFLSNHFLFHAWLPISGMAKQLKISHLPAWKPWHAFFADAREHLITVLPILLALGLLVRVYRRLSETEQILYPVVLLWPFAYVAMLSLVSDWDLWPWYYYPLRPALCIAFAVLLRWQSTVPRMRHTAVYVTLVLLATARSSRLRWAEGEMPQMIEVARDVQTFAVSHPGVFAMGDRAGAVGFLMPNALVQTEGLVMDRAFLEQIRHSASLRDVLQRYNTRFYVATEMPPYHPCYHAAEPYQAGPASPHMTGDFCRPVAIFSQAKRRTLIFDVSKP